MIKKNLKLFAILFIVLTIISSFSLCFADETKNEVATTNNATQEPTTAEQAEGTENKDVHNGDLYIFEPNVKMDKLVDGNVYIMGNNVEITGQINGNLFVLANSIKFDNSYVRYTIYACAKDIYYNGACNDLYAATQKLDMTYDSYVIRDVKAVSNNTIFKAAIGRDVDLQTNSLSLGEEEQVPIIYGNLRYSANQEQEIKDGIVEGEVTYNANSVKDNSKSVGENIKDIAITFLTVIVTALVIYLVLSKLTPNFVNNLANNISAGKIAKTCLKGLAIFVAGIVISLVLLITEIGVKLAFIIILGLILIALFTVPLTAIYIANALKPVLKIEKTLLYYVVLALVAVILQGITYIPFVAGIISFIIFIFGYGLLITTVWKNKELSEEEKQEKIAKKEAAKALKKEKKAEKAKLKEEKKSKKE